jgi:uncharacterized protein (DUF1015 family)
VPEFLPFRGIRYGVTDASAVTAPPYDVIDDDERAALAARDPFNAVRLILPEGGDDRCRAAAAAFRDWQARGLLVTDPAPRLYGYQMEFRDDGMPRTTTGVLGALRLPAHPGLETGVLPHERTLPKVRSDRLALLRATRANLDPIWGLSLAPGLSALVERPGVPLSSSTDAEGVVHRLFLLSGPDQITAVARAVARAPLVLADGHHRFETAVAYRDEQRASGRQQPGDDLILCLAVELAEDQLRVRAIHRLLSGLPSGFDLRHALATAFEVRDSGVNAPEGIGGLRATMTTAGGLGLVDERGLALLVPRGPAVEAVHELPESLRPIDAAVFETALLPALPDPEVAYRNDAATVAALVEKGTAQAAVLLRPVTVAQIHAAAAAGLRMPPKTTFFEPKPRTGLVFRSLDL